MAVKFDAGEVVKRGDLFWVNPGEIEVKEDLRGRCKNPSDDRVIALADSMMTHGQLQPVEVRRVEGSRLCITCGYTRTEAARLIRAGYTSLDGVARHDPNFLLKIMVVDTNEEQAFKRAIVENSLRNETSPVDDAKNQERLRDRYGMSDAEIASLYGYPNPSKVVRLRKLLTLDSKHQGMVHEGEMPVSAALDLLEVPAETRDEIIQEAKKETKSGKKAKINGTKVRKGVRKKAKKRKARTVAEIRSLLMAMIEDGDGRIQKIGGAFSDFIAGTKDETEALDEIKRNLS